MAYSLNNVILVGNLTEKPQLRETPSGAKVTDLNVQTKTRFTRDDDGSVQSSTGFHTVVLWGRLAEVAEQFLQAGSPVFISGRLKTEEWEADNGQKRRKTKIIGEEMVLIDSKNPLPQLAETSTVGGGVSRAQVLGNLTRDPELRQTPNGVNVCNFAVATNRKWRGKDSDELREETEFHNIVVWGDLAIEVSEKIKKGNKVLVTGRISNRGWETPDGEKRRTTEIIADEVLLLGFFDETAVTAGENSAQNFSQKNPGNSAAAKPAPESSSATEVSAESEIKPEDLPF